MPRANYFATDDKLDTLLRRAAWRLAHKKANGQLLEGPYFWPRPVKKHFMTLEVAAKQIKTHRILCTCSNGKSGACKSTRKFAAKQLAGIKLSAKLRAEIIETLAILAHAKRSGDTSPD